MSIVTCGVCGGDVGDPTEIDDFEPCHCTRPFLDENEGEDEDDDSEEGHYRPCLACGDEVRKPAHYCSAECAGDTEPIGAFDGFQHYTGENLQF